jgi:serine/threonine protein kinase
MHPHLALDPDFVAMFLDEARLVARIRHPNVVPTLDVVSREEALFLVMEYVEGESLSQLIKSARAMNERMPPKHVASVMIGVLQGLQAAHDARNDAGEPLGIVHRDVSPQNVLVGVDGVARVLDFGVAKAVGQSHMTRDGQLKGKHAYMAPEQVTGDPVGPWTDVFAATIVLWEALVGQRLFQGTTDAEILNRMLKLEVVPPSSLVHDLPRALDAVVLRGMHRDPGARFRTAAEMAAALEDALGMSSPRAVGEWVRRMAGERILARDKLVGEIELSSSNGLVPRQRDYAPEAGTVSQASISVLVPRRPNNRQRAAVAVGVVLAATTSLAVFALVLRTSQMHPEGLGAAPQAGTPAEPARPEARPASTATVAPVDPGAAPAAIADVDGGVLVPPAVKAPSETASAAASASAARKPARLPVSSVPPAASIKLRPLFGRE